MRTKGDPSGKNASLWYEAALNISSHARLTNAAAPFVPAYFSDGFERREEYDFPVERSEERELLVNTPGVSSRKMWCVASRRRVCSVVFHITRLNSTIERNGI